MNLKDKYLLLKEEQYDIGNISMETLERMLSETHEAHACDTGYKKMHTFNIFGVIDINTGIISLESADNYGCYHLF